MGGVAAPTPSTSMQESFSPQIVTGANSRRMLWLCASAICLLSLISGCKIPFTKSDAADTKLAATASFEKSDSSVKTLLASYHSSPQDSAIESPVSVSTAPPNVLEFDRLPRRSLTLDDAVSLAINNSTIIRKLGSHVLTIPNMTRSTYDRSLIASDPRIGRSAALSAFDTQFETGLVWNGGGTPVNSAFSSGQFGVFAQPDVLGKVGFGRVLPTGTKISIGGVTGYDSNLAGGLFAAYGGQIRHPLMRGSGRYFNQIAGPTAQPGMYRGVLISKIEEQKVQLELEQAIDDLVRDVANTYWELFFAYQSLEAKRAAMDAAQQTWDLEKQRLAVNATPADSEAMARQQYHSARAAFLNAISGVGQHSIGVFGIEVRLRDLLGLPLADGQILFPSTTPLDAEFHFDWDESVLLANDQRLELRKQQQTIKQTRLEMIAAQNLRKPQVDFVGSYRRLADDGREEAALFGNALNGWQLGLEYKRSIQNRRECAAVRNAQLKLHREQALLDEQRRQVMVELRNAFTELDRAFHVMQTLQVSREAAAIRASAEAQRHAAGDTHVEKSLQAQVRNVQAETAFQRSLVDYNLAFIRIHKARGTFFQLFGVAFGQPTHDQVRIAKTSASPFATGVINGRDDGETRIAEQQLEPTNTSRF